MMEKNQTRLISREEIIEREKARKADAERELLDQDPEQYIARHTLYGHAFQSHVANSPRSLLNNVLSGQKHGDTRFRDVETQNYCMQEILYNYMREIHDFVKKAKNGEQRLFAADFMQLDTDQPDYIGTGFVTTSADKKRPYSGDYQVNYIESNLAAVVVKKNPEAPDGWEITTAFPMSHPRNDVVTPSTHIRRPPDKNFKELLHQTASYQKASPVCKLAMDLKCANNRQSKRFMASYQSQSNTMPEQLVIRDTKNPGAPAIKITANKDGTGLDMVMYNRNRPELDLSQTETQQLARGTIPDLYQYAQEVIKANTGTRAKSRPRKTNRPGNSGIQGIASRNVSDMSIRTENPTVPDTGPEL